jgi:dolichol-phosphate mannosyltransferase
MKKLISFIIPALNEEKNIEKAIDGVLVSLKKFKISGEIIVVNDGSVDNTSLLIEKKIKEFPETIKIISHQAPQGMGASFWDGVDNALGDVVVMFPGDNENDSQEILRYYWLMDHVDFVVPFVFNKETRPFFRRFLSSLYGFIIRISFSINLNYINGTVLCRRSVLKELEHRSTGFFLQTDILVRVIKKGYLFAEVPHRLNLRKSGSSKAIKMSSLVCLIKEYLCLISDYYFKRKKLFKKQFAADSITFIRRNEK